MLAGGLGSQPRQADVMYEFLEEDLLLPTIEGVLRVFDRYGERNKRMKARLKFLIKSMGLPAFLELVKEEKAGLLETHIPIDVTVSEPEISLQPAKLIFDSTDHDFTRWVETNVIPQKQDGLYAISIRVPLGNISSNTARAFAALVEGLAENDIRITVNQGLLVRDVTPDNIYPFYQGLKQLNLAQPGFGGLADITSCPGTDTCALGVSNSTGLATQLEQVVTDEFAQFLNTPGLEIKISGCMNSCGQHMAANIGFHGSSIRVGDQLAPAMQVVLGGGVDQKGVGSVAEKVIKVPSKRVPDVVRYLLTDYEDSAEAEMYFNDYFQKKGKRYFYDLLKPLAQVSADDHALFLDWGQDEAYVRQIGVGECAGASLDLISGIFHEAEHRIGQAQAAFEEGKFAHAAYFAYHSHIITAKALLLSHDQACNTHQGIIRDFDQTAADWGFEFESGFKTHVLKIRDQRPDEQFAEMQQKHARSFLAAARTYHANRHDRLVINHAYKA